jgi:hypothetical protein
VRRKPHSALPKYEKGFLEGNMTQFYFARNESLKFHVEILKRIKTVR